MLHCILYILSVFALWLPKAVTLTLILIQWSGKVPFQFEKCQILIKQYGFRENGGWNITIWTTYSEFLWLRTSNGQLRSTDNHILFSSLNILHLKWIKVTTRFEGLKENFKSLLAPINNSLWNLNDGCCQRLQKQWIEMSTLWEGFQKSWQIRSFTCGPWGVIMAISVFFFNFFLDS